MEDKDGFINIIRSYKQQLEFNIKVSEACDGGIEEISLYKKILDSISRIYDLVSKSKLSVHYSKHFEGNIIEITKYLNLMNIMEEDVEGDSMRFYNALPAINIPYIEQSLKQLEFTLDFFKKLGFFNNNIVVIGANGSGKTSLSEKLKMYLSKDGVVISAQKVLIIPTFSGISNIINTQSELLESQRLDKTNKKTYSTINGNAYSLLSDLGNEFKILLANLIADNSMEEHKYVEMKRNNENAELPFTKLDRVFEIWNSLIEHRKIKCNDGINIILEGADIDDYPAYQMSDGEKVVLYHIAQVLQAPQDGFIIVDEPEMYLHKTILKKLWDILECERKDCLFIYLTHDLEYASSRVGSEKVWIKSFKYPDSWEFEKIPEQKMPESLIMELLGSRKNILFCEGKIGSYDEQIYNILFPEYTIKPLGSCNDVINYTKTFNELPSTKTKAFGVVDTDFMTEKRILALKENNIFPIEVAEVENLLLDEEFLAELAKQLMKEEKLDELKQDIFRQFGKDKELQVSNFLSAKVNYYFKESHMSKGNDLAKVEDNLATFIGKINLKEWNEERLEYIENVIALADYSSLLKVYNNKGLKRIVNEKLSINDFSERAIKFLQREKITHEMLKKYFPNELNE